MKKKAKKIIGIVILVVLAALLIWNLTDCGEVTVNGKTHALSFAESWQARSILLLRSYNVAGFGCPVSKNYSIKIGGLTYCPATDDCEGIYILELDAYYDTSVTNMEKLHKFIAQYK